MILLTVILCRFRPRLTLWFLRSDWRWIVARHVLGSHLRCGSWPLLADCRFDVRPWSFIRVEHGPVYIRRLLRAAGSLDLGCARLRARMHVLESTLANRLRIWCLRPGYGAVLHRASLLVECAAINWLRLRRPRHWAIHDAAVACVWLGLCARVHSPISIRRHSALYFDGLRPFRRALSYAPLRSTCLRGMRNDADWSCRHRRRLRIAGSFPRRYDPRRIRILRRTGRGGPGRAWHAAPDVFWLAIDGTPQLLFSLLVERTTRVRR